AICPAAGGRGSRGAAHDQPAAIRNLIRIMDFLPFFYGIGMLTLFINGRGKRLGDFAAGTLVVRDRERIGLYDLASTPTGPAPSNAPWRVEGDDVGNYDAHLFLDAPDCDPDRHPLDRVRRQCGASDPHRTESLPGRGSGEDRPATGHHRAGRERHPLRAVHSRLRFSKRLETLPTGDPGLDRVPPFDLSFAKLPAEKNGLTFAVVKKIDQPDT